MSFRLEGEATFAYPGGPVVLRDLTLSLAGGRTVAVLGRSGLGKTTLLNLLALLWDRGLAKGRIVYTSPRTGREHAYHALRPAEQARLRRDEFGLVPQVPHFLSGFTCGQNLRVPLALQGLSGAAARRRAEQLLAEVGAAGGDLGPVLAKYPGEVSTGQRQRLAVLRAVAPDPAVLFADEPVSNLDADNKARMLELFRLWRDNRLRLPGRPPCPRTLVLVCHEAETAWGLADAYLFLRPAASGEAGASAEGPVGHDELCERLGLSSDREAGRATGAEALRRCLGCGPAVPASVGEAP